MSRNILRHNTRLFYIFSLLLLFPLVSGCRKDEFVDTSISIVESYVINSIDYPDLRTSLRNSRPYVFNKGGYIEALDTTVNRIINYNEQQSDTTTLLVYRYDVDYPVKNVPIRVCVLPDGNINLNASFEMHKDDNVYDSCYVNIICVKVPKIPDLKTFSFSSDLTIKYNAGNSF